jgi:cobalt/nickel transport system permease protein
MHIADGVISAPVLVATVALAAVGTGIGLKRMRDEDTPRIGIVAAVFFVASLIHVPIGPSSAHLVLTGLVGLLLGWHAFPAVGAALLLQTVFFGYGGLTSWGANVLTMALPAVICYYAFRPVLYRAHSLRAAFAVGALAGAGGLVLSGLVLSGTLFLSGREFTGAAAAILIAHVPVMVVEGVVTGAVAAFLLRVKPEMLTTKGTDL